MVRCGISHQRYNTARYGTIPYHLIPTTTTIPTTIPHLIPSRAFIPHRGYGERLKKPRAKQRAGSAITGKGLARSYPIIHPLLSSPPPYTTVHRISTIWCSTRHFCFYSAAETDSKARAESESAHIWCVVAVVILPTSGIFVCLGLVVCLSYSLCAPCRAGMMMMMMMMCIRFALVVAIVGASGFDCEGMMGCAHSLLTAMVVTRRGTMR